MSESHVSRRAFLARAGVGMAAVSLGARALHAQQASPAGVVAAGDSAGSSNLFSMDQEAARPVRLPPKPNAKPSMSAADRDALEHRIKCQCGCTLDVYTCRTTDFSCTVSPAMHRDVVALVEGGYSAQEIIDAFVNVYGEQALMAPTSQGFNLLGWTMPFLAFVGGAIAVAVLVKRWGSRPQRPVAATAGAPGVDATPDEIARLEAAIRNDEE